MAYSGVFVFGDSLVDAGNVLKLAKWYGTLTFSDLPEGAPDAELGYFNGRFSDGYTFADLVSNKYIGVPTTTIFPYFYEDPWMGVKIAPWASDPNGNNLNFAYGGAQIRQGEEVAPDLDGQTDAFRHAVDGNADSDALYLITIGGNDVRRLAPSDAAPVAYDEALATLQQAADRFYDEVAQLIEIGVENIVVTGIPDVGMIPQYDLDGDKVLTGDELIRSQAATQYSALLDSLIQQQIALIEAGHPSANITYVSLTEATDENLAALETLYGRPIDPLADQDLLFFDQIHPSAQSHALLAAAITDTVNGVTGNNRLPLTAPDYSAGGVIGLKGEVDKIVVSLVAGATYTFEMVGISTGNGTLTDPKFSIIGPAGTVVGSNDDGGLGLDATLTFTATATGDYVVQLSGVGSMTGTYGFLAAGDAAGNNVYTVTHGDALILERAGEGLDTVKTSVSYTLGQGASIEVLRTSQDRGTASINLTGNETAQQIVGNSGANLIDGKGGNDTLTGGAGKDKFGFTSELGGNIDRITDFNVRDDTIVLDDAIFKGLVLGTLTTGAFTKGTKATQADDRIIYDPASGKLYFDPDGVGGLDQVQFGLIGTGLKLTSADFLIA